MRSGGTRGLAMAAGGLLLAAAGVLAYLRQDEETVSFALGAAFGSVAFGVLLGALIRYLWVRFGSGSPPALDPPWFLLVAGMVAFAGSGANAARQAKESEETYERAIGAIERGAETCPPLRLGESSGGYSMDEAAPRLERLLERSVSRTAPPEVVDAAGYYVVTSRGRFVAAITTLPFDPEEIAAGGGQDQVTADALAGASDALAERGLSPADTEVAGQPAVGTQVLAREYQLTALSGCNLLNVAAVDEERARAALEALLESAT
jgi:hypothetical protein